MEALWAFLEHLPDIIKGMVVMAAIFVSVPLYLLHKGFRIKVYKPGEEQESGALDLRGLSGLVASLSAAVVQIEERAESIQRSAVALARSTVGPTEGSLDSVNEALTQIITSLAGVAKRVQDLSLKIDRRLPAP